MFETVIALNMLMSGVSLYQTNRALGDIEQQQAFIQHQDQATVEKLRASGVQLGKTMRTLRYCKDARNMRRLHAFVVQKMSPYGPYGDIVVQTMEEVGQTQPDLSKAPAGFSCASNRKIANDVFAKLGFAR